MWLTSLSKRIFCRSIAICRRIVNDDDSEILSKATHEWNLKQENSDNVRIEINFFSGQHNLYWFKN